MASTKRSSKPTKGDGPGRRLRCAVYTRVSSDRQDIENSLDRQLRACRDWAERNGGRILEDHIYTDEARSGVSSLSRPGFQALLLNLHARTPLPFDAVLVDDDSRLDRGGKLATIAEMFQAKSVQLVAVDSGRDLTDENERLLVHVKSGLNEHFVRELARRTRAGIASKVLKGFHGGGTCFGYTLTPEWPDRIPVAKRDRENRSGTRVQVDPDQAEVVREIFRWYAMGVGFHAIARRLNERDKAAPRGGTWDMSCVRVILLNPKYIGDWSWNRSRWQKVPESLMTEAQRERVRRTGRHPRQRTSRPAEDIVAYRAEGLRIVEDELWSRVQSRFEGRTGFQKGRDTYRRTRNIIAGLLHCTCGGHVVATSSTRKGHRYVRLYCSWARTRGPRVCQNTVQMRFESIAEPLLDLVREKLLSLDYVRTATAEVNRKLKEGPPSARSAARLATLSDEISGLEREIQSLVEALARGKAYDAISAALDERERRLAKARENLRALEVDSAGSGAGPVEWREADVIARLAHLCEDLQRCDADRARLALELVIERIDLKPLDGDWQNGWLLQLKTRPWAVAVPKGEVARFFGSGGGI